MDELPRDFRLSKIRPKKLRPAIVALPALRSKTPHLRYVRTGSTTIPTHQQTSSFARGRAIEFDEIPLVGLGSILLIDG